MPRLSVEQRIADAIKDARIESGISQVKLAEKIGVTDRTIRRVEGGYTSSLSTAIKVCRGVGIRFWEVVKEAEEKYS